MTSIRDLNANFTRKAEALETIAAGSSLIQEQALEVLDGFNSEYTNAAKLVDLLHQSTRLQLIQGAGAQNNAALLDDLAQTSSLRWDEAMELPVENAMQERVGEQFLKAPLTKPGANVVIRTQPYATKITETLVEGFVKRGELFDVVINDVDWKARLLNGIDHDGAKGAGEVLSDIFDRCEKTMSIGATIETGDDVTEVEDQEKKNLLNAYGKEFGKKSGSIDNFYTLTKVPTPHDAQVDDMEYEQYLCLFFELCDQPWEEVSKAQVKLIEKFDAAKEVRMTNEDGTDLTIGIDGFTFANSVTKKNIPGGEIFSGVERESLDGTLVSKGKFKPPHVDGVIEDITMRFENGKVVEAHAEKGEEHLLAALDAEENTRFVGELGIGTNPWLKQHVMNSLLVEKIGGSFHLALGACYTYTEYDGDPVVMDNGNHAKSHWDLTTMLKGNGGKMFLDGELIQDNGEFLGEEFKVFNEGWKALPPEERPEYWKDKLAEQAQKREQGFAARLG